MDDPSTGGGEGMREKTVLLVEDNEDTMNINRTALAMRGWRVLEARTLWEAHDVLERETPDAVVLDVMLPDGSGFDFCREAERGGIPVLFLTALGSKGDVLRGLSAGGDDYLAKPYDLDILTARVESLLRRSRHIGTGWPQRFELGPLAFDIVASKAFSDGRDLRLTQKEFALLLALSQSAGRTTPAHELYESVWGRPMGEDGGVLWRHISSLRKKLPESGRVAILSAPRGGGYSLEIAGEGGSGGKNGGIRR